MKKYFMFGLCIFMAVIGFCGCSEEFEPIVVEEKKTDEEIVEELAQKFVLALYTQNEKLAREICNDTGFSTYELLAGMMTLGTMGMNEMLKDDAGVAANIIANTNVVKTTMIDSSRAVVSLLITTDSEKPHKMAIPLEKDSNGEWKVAVTKSSLG